MQLPITKKYVPTSSTVPKEVVGQLFILPANTTFWLIESQLSIKVLHKLIIKITNTTIHDNIVFGIIQNTVLTTYPLEGYSYYDNKKSKISVNFANLMPL